MAQSNNSDENIKYAIREIDENFSFNDNYEDYEDDEQNVLSVSSLIDDVLFGPDNDENYNIILKSDVYEGEHGEKPNDEDILKDTLPNDVDQSTSGVDDRMDTNTTQHYLHEINFLKNQLKKANLNHINLIGTLKYEKMNKAKLRETNLILRQKNDELTRETRGLKIELNSLNQTNENLNKDLNNLIQIRLKILNDSKRYKYEYDELRAEYMQVMSERDCVHKEIEALQEQLCKEKDKYKSQLTNNQGDLGAIKLELENMKAERDTIMQQNKNLKETVEILSQSMGDLHEMTNGLSLSEKYFLAKDEKLLLENERLKEDVDDLQKELEVAKKRRDWAFNERDKMVKERESIRALCDEFRNHRDKAISELAETLKEFDETKKQKNLALKQINTLEENLNLLEEKLFDMIHAETNEKWITLNVEVEKDDSLNKSIGIHFTIVGDDRNSSAEIRAYVVIVTVIKNGPAYGKLKEYDRILKINEIDLTGMSVEEITEFIKNTDGKLNFLICRQENKKHQVSRSHSTYQDSDCKIDPIGSASRQTSKHNKSNQDNIKKPTKQIVTLHKRSMNDLLFETGVYVAALKPTADTKNYVDIGDRILSINGVRLANKSYKEVVELIRQIKKNFSLAILKSSGNLKTIDLVAENSDCSYVDDVPLAYDNCFDEDLFLMSNNGTYDDVDTDDRFDNDSLMCNMKSRQHASIANNYSDNNKFFRNDHRSTHSSIYSTSNNINGRIGRKSTNSYYRNMDDDTSNNDTFDLTTLSNVQENVRRVTRNQHKMTSARYERHDVIRQKHQQSDQRDLFLGTWPKHSNQNTKLSIPNADDSAEISKKKRTLKQDSRKTILNDIFTKNSHFSNPISNSNSDEKSISLRQRHEITHNAQKPLVRPHTPPPKRANRVSSNETSRSSSGIDPAAVSQKPFFQSNTTDVTDESLNPLNNEDQDQDEPTENEIRSISFERTNEFLGLSISENSNSNCLYISNVDDKSNAYKAGIREGDQLIEICGIDLRNKAVDEVLRIIPECCANSAFISFLVQYKPENLQDTDDDMECATDLTKRQVLPMPIQTCSDSILKPTTRTIVFRRPLTELGIRLCGGNNANGVFVDDLAVDCPLKKGDQLLKINNYALSFLTLEKVSHMLFGNQENKCLVSDGNAVRLTVKYNKQMYESIDYNAPDSFYIMCLNDRDAKNPNELHLRKFDIYHVVDTLPSGMYAGLWKARLIHREYEYEGENFNEYKIGLIPSMHRFLAELSETNENDETLSNDPKTAQNIKKRMRTSSKCEQFIDLPSIIKSIAIEIKQQKHKPLTYKLIEFIDNKTIQRPCIVLGALSTCICECLQNEFPLMFKYFKQEDAKYATFTKNDSRLFDLNTLQNNSHKHVLLSNLYSLNEIDNLKKIKLYPIILCLKYKSPKQLLAFNNNILYSYFLNSRHSLRTIEKINSKTAKNLFDHTENLERQYKNYITNSADTTNATNPIDLKLIVDYINTVVTSEQNKTIWIPVNSDKNVFF